jgi:hypothetical protein
MTSRDLGAGSVSADVADANVGDANVGAELLSIVF